VGKGAWVDNPWFGGKEGFGSKGWEKISGKTVSQEYLGKKKYNGIEREKP